MSTGFWGKVMRLEREYERGEISRPDYDQELQQLELGHFCDLHDRRAKYATTRAYGVMEMPDDAS